MGTRNTLIQSEEERSSQNDFAELRNLLLGDQIQELEKLRRRLDDPNLRSEETSKILAQALSLSALVDPRLQLTLQPIIERALRISVERDPHILADALFPIVGQAVRKAVANSLEQILDSLNAVLTRGFSLKRLGWRLEAIRSGKSFGEIALARSLAYRVEHVYLIHRKTGLLLAESSRTPGLLVEPSLVVGMLTALQDFVRDSFTTNKQDDLDVLHIGEFKVWLVHGPLALFAFVVRGQLPQQLLARFSDRIEAVNEKFRTQLSSFETTGQPIADIGEGLDACLLGGASTEKPSYTRVKIAAGLFLTGALIAMFFPIRDGIRWQNYLRALKREPGVVVIEQHRRWSTFSLVGLRDPKAIDPHSILSGFHLSESKVNEQWREYLSLDPQFDNARKLEDAAASLTSQSIHFDKNSAELRPDQLLLLDTISDEIRQIVRLAASQGKHVSVQAVGYTDGSGTEHRNGELYLERAQTVVSLLSARGIDPKFLSSLERSASVLAESKASGRENYSDRRVNFLVLINGKQ